MSSFATYLGPGIGEGLFGFSIARDKSLSHSLTRVLWDTRASMDCQRAREARNHVTCSIWG